MSNATHTAGSKDWIAPAHDATEISVPPEFVEEAVAVRTDSDRYASIDGASLARVTLEDSRLVRDRQKI